MHPNDSGGVDDPSRPPVRVLIADRDPLVRRVVRDVLQTAGVIVVAEAANGSDAARLALHYEPDVVLIDALMPELDAVSAIRRIVAGSARVRVVLFTSADTDAAIGGLKAGASGYVTKDTDLEALPRIVRAVASGEVAISRSFVSVLLDSLRAAPDGHVGLRPVRSPLSAREWEVLDLLCVGLATRDIADALVLSPETVRSHLKRIMRKLGVSSRSDAIEAAARVRARAGESGGPALTSLALAA